MTRFTVTNTSSGHSFGTYEAKSAEEAIEACVKDAGYASIEDMERQLESPCELQAISQES